MKVRLINKNVMSPLLVNNQEGSALRVSGLLEMTGEMGVCTKNVYGFRHVEDQIRYQLESVSAQTLEWVQHEEPMSYQPYAPVVVSALSQMPTKWDGVMYRYADSAYQYVATRERVMTIIDCYVSQTRDLWFLVNLSMEADLEYPKSSLHPVSGWIAATKLGSPLALPEILHLDEGGQRLAADCIAQAVG
ncbi:MAG: hypothetical protein V3U76_12825 [Granulosicoccus sp.]